MQERTVNKSQTKISPELQEYINELAKEVVLNGKDFNSQKKWLKKYVEAEGVDFEDVKNHLKDYFKKIEIYSETKDKTLKNKIFSQGVLSFISNKTTNEIVAKIDQKIKVEYLSPDKELIITIKKKAKLFPFQTWWIILVFVLGIFISYIIFISNSSEENENQIYEDVETPIVNVERKRKDIDKITIEDARKTFYNYQNCYVNIEPNRIGDLHRYYTDNVKRFFRLENVDKKEVLSNIKAGRWKTTYFKILNFISIKEKNAFEYDLLLDVQNKRSGENRKFNVKGIIKFERENGCIKINYIYDYKTKRIYN